MHPRAVEEIVASVRRRITQGDRPTEPPQPREVLEEALLELAGPSVKLRFSNEGLRNKLASDPDDEPMAGATLSATVVQYKPCEICTTQSWCETHGCQCYPVSAVQSERCCLDYPRCDCNSPPEPDNAPTLQPCGHPWKAQDDFKCILCSSPG